MNRSRESDPRSIVDDALYRDVVRTVTRATSRDEIERIVCERLAGRPGLEFAWIGTEATTGEFSHRSRAGLGNGYVRTATFDDEWFERIRNRADRNRVAVVDDFEDDDVPARRTTLAIDRGFRSAAFVDLSHRGVSFGLLAVYAAEPKSFEGARDLLADLGEAIGYAIGGAEQTRALVSDSVIELEFDVRDEELLFIWLSERADCRVELDGLLLESDGALSLFVRVENGDPATVADRALERATIEAATVIDERGLVQLRLSESPIAEYLAEQGAVLRELDADRGRGAATIELPPQSDVRSFVERITTAFPDVDLVARREHPRQLRTQGDLRDLLAERLTDRQHEVLQVAYHAGFYQWPRDHSGAELADRLEIAQPTFLQHLRAAERKLLAACFDDHRSIYSRRD